MLKIFSEIKTFFKVKFDSQCIDNPVFKLHYRVTVIILLVATILVTCREWIGEHIKCICDINKDYIKVVETYCFFTSTFTLIQNRTFDFEKYGLLGYMGHLGLEEQDSEKNIRRHYYYQWVPFVLFFQAIMFYLTHILWKNLEGGRIKKLVAGLGHSALAVSTKEVKIGDQTVPSRQKIENCLERIRKTFFERITLDKSWARWLIFCETLNVFHVALQISITHRFLGKQFYLLGPNVIKHGYKTLDEIFPKAAKCHFHKYGHSGSIQKHDALCILALNIVNEKIYVFLWFWFVSLLAVSCLALLWRALSVVLYSRSVLFNRVVFGMASRKKLYPWHLKMVAKNFCYSDWLLLKYLAKNMSGMAFKELFINISDNLEETKPLCMLPKEQKRID